MVFGHGAQQAAHAAEAAAAPAQRRAGSSRIAVPSYALALLPVRLPRIDLAPTAPEWSNRLDFSTPPAGPEFRS